ncbi:MAG: T9SS type A sorting domain-containing protein [candidate division KSB1 bacterium]|nr:T9SS type A sorting domain-containing protein [candidate division KSB1 bacterium]MDZ7303684.1 T9SS type A sorting domain-containing protein [candidate division KSB1 bacterium]
MRSPLEQNYPNPFNPATTIRFSLPQRSHVVLKVFDVHGREVATLVDGNLVAGNHVVTFVPHRLPSGRYFYSLTAGKFKQTRKAVLVN